MEKPAEIEPENVPGTVQMVDFLGTSRAKEQISHGNNIILIPQPTDDPNDPLKWSRSKKLIQFWFLWFWAFMQGVITNWTGPVYSTWIKDLGCTEMELNIARAIMLLFLGMGCLFLQPAALKLGRRFVYMLCTVVQIVVCIVGSQMNSIKVYYVMQILTGFAASPGDALVEISTTDVFFQHERTEKLTWFILALYAGCDLGPVACGYVISNLSWRWCFYIQLIIFAATLVAQFFFMDDTTFTREESNTVVPQGSHSSNSGLEKRNYITDVEEKPLLDGESDESSLKPRSYWLRRRLYETEYNDKRLYISLLIRPLVMLIFPGVVWSGLVYGAQMFWLSLLSVTQSEFYSAPPYNFSTATVGLTNVGAFVGAVLGAIYGGAFVDYLTIKLAVRNKGIMEPEFRLWAMLVPTIFNAGGLLAYGLSIYYGAFWFVSVGIGQALLGFSMTSSGGICLTYCVDCSPLLAKDALVLILLIRNLIGCGFTFAISPWIETCGLMVTTWLMFMISIVINAIFICFIKWGKDLRIWNKQRYESFSGTYSSKVLSN